MVQAQNDFITASTALNKARPTLDLAQINDKRQRLLYEGKGALPADQAQRARPRSRQRHPGGATQGRRAGGPAGRLPARMGRRIRQPAGRDRAAQSWYRLSLALIALLLWVDFGSVPDTLLAMSVIPMAVVGGIFALVLLAIPFSVSAAIGFIALFGISVIDGIIILSQSMR